MARLYLIPKAPETLQKGMLLTVHLVLAHKRRSCDSRSECRTADHSGMHLYAYDPRMLPPRSSLPKLLQRNNLH